MKSGNVEDKKRKRVIDEVIKRIEAAFEGSIVVHTGTGTPSDEYRDDTESFEAFMIEDDDLERFIDFEWELNENYTEPLGVTISVDALNPEVTMKYRRDEYNAAIKAKEALKTKANI